MPSRQLPATRNLPAPIQRSTPLVADWKESPDAPGDAPYAPDVTTSVASCPQCAAPAAPGSRFCSACGAALALVCPNCAAPASGRFCSQCGTPLPDNAPAAAGGAAAVVEPRTAASPGAPTAAHAPVSERRVTTVLFADLVGFTPLSEARDSEDVRDLLARYFDVARVVVGRFGGTVEKFIGD